MTDSVKMSGWVLTRMTDRHTPLLRGCQCQSKGTVAGAEGCVVRCVTAQTAHLKKGASLVTLETWRGASPCTNVQDLAKSSTLAGRVGGYRMLRSFTQGYTFWSFCVLGRGCVG